MSTWAPRLGLVLVLGCSFVYFLGAGSRTFTSSGEDDTAATWAQISFTWSGAVATLILGLYVPIRLYNGIASGKCRSSRGAHGNCSPPTILLSDQPDKYLCSSC